jgi:glycosyltransferase involved in cell wall biosynthesis
LRRIPRAAQPDARMNSPSTGSRSYGVNVHLYPTQLTHESRMDRICEAVVAMDVFASVEQVGIAGPGLRPEELAPGGFRRVRIPGTQRDARGIVGKVLSALSWSWRTYRRYRGREVRCVNAHSLATLLVGVALAWRHRARLIYDTHELETETVMARGLRRPLLRLVERVLIRFCDGVSVVSPGIADWYATTYKIARPVVVRNLPLAVQEFGLDRMVLRKRFDIRDDALVFLYQGLLARGRLVEVFLSSFAAHPDRHLVLLGFGPLESEVREFAQRYGNIHFHPAVPPSEIRGVTVGADVGLCGVADVCLSYHLSLPNKLFEYWSAGIPVLAPALPEIASLVEETAAGWVVHNGDWMTTVGALERETIDRARPAARTAGRRLTWEAETSVL